MANHNNTGKKGEALAVEYLTKKNFNVLHLNWRHSHYEIDIIATSDNILHFIEVKTRRSTKFGMPEESVTDKKLQNLINAADEFLYQFPQWKRVQFDVLSINIKPDSSVEFYFIEDVYL